MVLKYIAMGALSAAVDLELNNAIKYLGIVIDKKVPREENIHYKLRQIIPKFLSLLTYHVFFQARLCFM